MFNFLPHSVLQMSTIFLSIIIEALPFVMLGCLISGMLSVFLTPERVKKFLPKNKLLSIIVGSLLGFFFPSCECGIVPIVHQFIKKEVPAYTAFSFMITAPVINPLVIFSTYIAFGNSMTFVLWRVFGSLLVSISVGIWLAYIHKSTILLNEHREKETSGVETTTAAPVPQKSTKHKVGHVLVHGVDEFFDTGKYLVVGSLLAAVMQTYLPTGTILELGKTKLLAIVVMLLLAAILSLCSEADAFIGSSLLSLFGNGPVVAFLVFGPVIDIKNLLMMKRSFTIHFMVRFIALVTVVVGLYALFI